MTATADPLRDATDPAVEDLAAAVEVLRHAIAQLADDAGAVLTTEAAAAWAVVHDADPAEYERQRRAARQRGARVTEIDKIISASKKHARKKPKAQTNFRSNPSDPYGTRDEPLRDPSETPPKPEGSLPPGALLETGDEGTRHRLIDSLAADVVANALRRRLAWDGEAGIWLWWEGTHWEPLSVAARADRLLAEAVHVGTHPMGYRVTFLNGITAIIQRRGLLVPNIVRDGSIPFRNGLLDPATRVLTPATPDNAMDWCLPHDYTTGADCPTIKAWLLRNVENDADTVDLLRAWLAALLRGIPLQKFLLLLGRGGSGKGTFQRLAIALVGAANNAVCSLRDLEQNRFETAKLYGKRLCTINEAGKHGGALNMLKAMTGGDHLPLERKNVQQTGSFVFGGLVLMATNEDLQSTDSTSGLERRRITVRFPVSATPAEKAEWQARGGEAAVLHAEIPGLVNWLLQMSEADIRARIESPPSRVAADNRLGMAAGNSVADWLLAETVPDAEAWTQVGEKQERRDQGTGKTYFEKAAEWLYPSYLTWCVKAGRSRPVSLVKFRGIVVDITETLGHPVTSEKDPKTRAQGVKGLRLRKDHPSEPDDPWRGAGGDVAPERMDRRGSAPNFTQENSETEDIPDDAEVL